MDRPPTPPPPVPQIYDQYRGPNSEEFNMAVVAEYCMSV